MLNNVILINLIRELFAKTKESMTSDKTVEPKDEQEIAQKKVTIIGVMIHTLEGIRAKAQKVAQPPKF